MQHVFFLVIASSLRTRPRPFQDNEHLEFVHDIRLAGEEVHTLSLSLPLSLSLVWACVNIANEDHEVK